MSGLRIGWAAFLVERLLEGRRRRAMPVVMCRGKAGCPNLVERGICAACKGLGWGKDARPNASARLYDAWWQRERKRFLREFPFCADVYNEHAFEMQIVPANEVDHIVPHRGDVTLFRDRANWQSLCKHCHSRKTATEDGGFGRRDAVSQTAANGGTR